MLKYLVEKEFIQLKRNPFLPRLIVLFPLMILLFLPLAANFEVRNITIAVMDSDRSPLSCRLVDKVISSGYFTLSSVMHDYDQALKTIELDTSDILLEIPEGFERDLMKEGEAKVLLSVNAVNGTKGGLGSSYLSGIIQDFAAEMRADLMQSAFRSPTPRFSVIAQYRFNSYLQYPTFMVPALMVILLTMLCGFLPALNIVGEKEKGTMEQMNVTPVRKITVILSKLIPYWVIGFIVLSIGFVIAWIFYDLVPAGHLWTIYLFASIFIVGISGSGLVISNYAKTLQQAMFMMFFFVITFIFMSGLYTPVNSMPAWARMVSNFIPLKYMIMVFRMVYLKGSGFQDLWTEFLALCAFAFVFNGWAVFSYRKTS